MKDEIHPPYMDCSVTCSCGNTFQTRAVIEDIHLSVCSACHPFYTGQQKMLDTEGRVDRFKKKYAKFQKAQA